MDPSRGQDTKARIGAGLRVRFDRLGLEFSWTYEPFRSDTPDCAPRPEPMDQMPIQARIDTWLHRIKAMLGPGPSTTEFAHEIEGWLPLVVDAAQGNEWSEGELHRLVAFQARNMGRQGQPTSLTLSRLQVVEEVLAHTNDSKEEGQKLKTQIADLSGLAVDAHQLGLTDRLARKHILSFKHSAPVIHLKDRAIIGFLLGPMEAEIIDAMLGRILTECSRRGIRTAALDVLGAEPDNETFHRSILGTTQLEDRPCTALTLTGLRNIEATRASLNKMGVDPARVAYLPDVDSFIQQLDDFNA